MTESRDFTCLRNPGACVRLRERRTVAEVWRATGRVPEKRGQATWGAV